MKCVSHEQARQLLHNKFVVVLGDSSELAKCMFSKFLFEEDPLIVYGCTLGRKIC